jgi:hypothetical protein
MDEIQTALMVVAVNICVLGAVFLAACWFNRSARPSGR